jgi:hypothetical protein
MQTQGSGAAPTWVAQSSITAGSATTATTATNATNVGVTDDTTTATNVYPTWVTNTTGNLPIKTASTKLSFVPSTGALSIGSYLGIGTAAASGFSLKILAPTNTEYASFDGTTSAYCYAEYKFAGTTYGSIGTGNSTVSGAAATDLGFGSPGNIVFATGGVTERMRISSTGLVGIGTSSPGAKLSVVGTGYSPNITLSDAATIAWDTSTGQVATFTFVSSNRTMGAPTNLVNGGFYALAVIQNAGSNTLTWNSVFKWASGTAPTLSTAASAKDYFTFRSDGTNLYQQGSSLGVA